MYRYILLAAALFGGLAVGLGAFGAHGLKAILDSNALETFELAVRYQMYHALALLATGIWAERRPESQSLRVAGWAFGLGILLFCGSLFIMSTTGLRGGIVFLTPLGGTAFIVGWVALVVAAVRSQ